RTVAWTESRVWRIDNDRLVLLHRSTDVEFLERGLVAPDDAALREQAISSNEAIVVSDASHDERLAEATERPWSILMLPLRFGDRTLGLVELAHHKRRIYGTKQIQMAGRFASQLATLIHIHELRVPLLQAVTRLDVQVETFSSS